MLMTKRYHFSDVHAALDIVLNESPKKSFDTEILKN